MTKKKKKIITSIFVSLPLVSIGVVTAITLANKNKSNNSYDNADLLNWENVYDTDIDFESGNYGLVYDDKLYSSPNEVLKMFMSRNQNSISSDVYLGNPYAQGAIYDKTYNIINTDYLRKYDQSKIYSAYKDVGGDYHYNFKAAKKTYIESANIYYMYDDLNGNLFDSENEAQESISKSNKATPLMYYEMPNLPSFDKDSKTKFNPLSATDLKTFKKDIYKFIKDLLDNSESLKNQKNLSVSIYDSDNASTTRNSFVKFRSIDSDKLDIDYFARKLLDELIMAIFKGKINYLAQNIKFDVELKTKTVISHSDGSLENGRYMKKVPGSYPHQNPPPITIQPSFSKPHSCSPAWMGWKVEGFDAEASKATSQPVTLKSQINSLTDSNENSILFQNISLPELKDFQIFLNRDELIKSNYTELSQNQQYESLKVKGFKNATFSLNFAAQGKCFYDHGGRNNQQGMILDIGSKDIGLGFDVIVTLSSENANKPSITEMKKYIDSEIDSLKRDQNSLVGKVYTTLASNIKDDFLNMLSNSDNMFVNSGNSFKLRYCNSKLDFEKTADTLENIYNYSLIDSNNLALNNIFLFGFINYQSDKRIPIPYLTKGQSNASLNGLNGINISYNDVFNKSSGDGSVKNLLEASNNNLKLVIEYNNNPLFTINKSLPSDLNDKTFNTIVKETFFNKVLESDIENEINYMENVSFDFIKEKDTKTSKIYNTIGQKDYDYIKFDKTNKYLEFVSPEDLSKSAYDKYPAKPTLSKQSGLDDYKINSIIEVYNEIILKSPNAKDLNKPEDIIFLFDRSGDTTLNPRKMSYREFISNGSNTILPLYNDTSVELYRTTADRDHALKSKVDLKPAKVIIIKDKKGKIINPGVKLTGNQLISSTNDAIYDSQQTIFDNLWRTTLLPKSDMYVFYDDNGKGYDEDSDDNTQMSLISNTLNRIYHFNYGKDNLSFLTYKDCMSYIWYVHLKPKTRIVHFKE